MDLYFLLSVFAIIASILYVVFCIILPITLHHLFRFLDKLEHKRYMNSNHIKIERPIKKYYGGV